MTLPKWQHPQLHSQSVTQFFHDNNFQNNCTVLILDRSLCPWFSQPSLGGTFWFKWNCRVLNVYGIAKLLFSKASPMNSSTSSLWQCFLPLSAFLIFVNLLSKMQCKCKKQNLTVLVCIFLIRTDSVHPFIYLLDVCIFSVNFIFHKLHIFYWKIDLFFLLVSKSCLQIVALFSLGRSYHYLVLAKFRSQGGFTFILLLPLWVSKIPSSSLEGCECPEPLEKGLN